MGTQLKFNFEQQSAICEPETVTAPKADLPVVLSKLSAVTGAFRCIGEVALIEGVGIFFQGEPTVMHDPAEKAITEIFIPLGAIVHASYAGDDSGLKPSSQGIFIAANHVTDEGKEVTRHYIFKVEEKAGREFSTLLNREMGLNEKRKPNSDLEKHFA